MRRRWGIHFCHPWSECARRDGAPVRLYIHTPHGSLIIGSPTQVYDRKRKRYTDEFSHIVWHPHDKR